MVSLAKIQIILILTKLFHKNLHKRQEINRAG